MQMLDLRPSEEPVLTVDEQPIKYDAQQIFHPIQLNTYSVMQPTGSCITPFYFRVHTLAARTHRTLKNTQEIPLCRLHHARYMEKPDTEQSIVRMHEKWGFRLPILSNLRNINRKVYGFLSTS